MSDTSANGDDATTFDRINEVMSSLVGEYDLHSPSVHIGLTLAFRHPEWARAVVDAADGGMLTNIYVMHRIVDEFVKRWPIQVTR